MRMRLHDKWMVKLYVCTVHIHIYVHTYTCRLHTVSIGPLIKHITKVLEDLGLSTINASDLVDQMLGYGGSGYEISDDKELGMCDLQLKVCCLVFRP